MAAGTSKLPAPYTREEYDAAIDAALKRQMEDWQAGNSDFFQASFAADIGEDAPLFPFDPSNFLKLLLLGGAAVVALLLVVRE